MGVRQWRTGSTPRRKVCTVERSYYCCNFVQIAVVSDEVRKMTENDLENMLKTHPLRALQPRHFMTTLIGNAELTKYLEGIYLAETQLATCT